MIPSESACTISSLKFLLHLKLSDSNFSKDLNYLKTAHIPLTSTISLFSNVIYTMSFLSLRSDRISFAYLASMTQFSVTYPSPPKIEEEISQLSDSGIKVKIYKTHALTRCFICLHILIYIFKYSFYLFY